MTTKALTIASAIAGFAGAVAISVGPASAVPSELCTDANGVPSATACEVEGGVEGVPDPNLNTPEGDGLEDPAG